MRKISWIHWGLIILTILDVTKEVVGPHICSRMGIHNFCVIANHFKKLHSKTIPTPYPDLKKVIEILPANVFSPTEGGTLVHIESIATYNINCELKYVQAKFPKGIEGSPGDGIALNPYSIEVTEIEVNSQRMHNWLHIKIKGDPAKAAAFAAFGGKVTGRIKYAFLEVHDEISYAVGDFHNHMPCGHDCDCKPPDCYQASAKDSIPCMYANKTVTTAPGHMMFYFEKGVTEIHATWRFAQFQHKSTFRTELHFKSLLIESDVVFESNTNYNIDVFSSETNLYKGIHGYNAYYDILWPTMKTLGGWDYYRDTVYRKSQINCHKPINYGEYYIKEEYPTFGPLGVKALEGYSGPNVYAYLKSGESGKATPTAFRGARNDDYSSLSNSDGRLYFGYFRQATPYFFLPATAAWDQKKLSAGLWGERHPNFPPGTDKPNVWGELDVLKKIASNAMFDIDKCGCPKFATTPAPADVPPPPIQLQGRKTHAVQMIIAWLCLVPFGMFIARYYKETYSKVFFIQEFWWYSIHVLCFAAAAMFMLGGIYAIEINRKDPIRWGDVNIFLHVVSGGVAILLFLCHLSLGHQRFRHVETRMLQIMLHWAFGFIEYILAITSIILAAFVLQGCMACLPFFIVCVWIVVQLLFYIFMEIHMRSVDKALHLHPPRRYLPPPVMRVFHMNAPGAKFRIYMLILYGTLCFTVYGTVHVLIKYNLDGESCFKVKTSSNASNITARLNDRV